MATAALNRARRYALKAAKIEPSRSSDHCKTLNRAFSLNAATSRLLTSF